MENIREHIYLAALLHDIGKFYQRAEDGFKDLSPYSKDLAEDICPINDSGRFGYQHVVWTNEFLEKKEIKDKLIKVPGIKQNLYGEENAENSLASFACRHHKPVTEMQAIITMADWWSAGIDRTNSATFEKDEVVNEPISWGKQRYKQIPLYSVFNNINGGAYQSAFILRALSLNEDTFFPKSIIERKDGLSQTSYHRLWDQFLEEFAKLPTDSFDGFTESLLFLLKKYTWCIPSNTMDMSNVSLFDHLKTTAAFADCLYLFKDEHPNDVIWDGVRNRLSINEGTMPVILLGGDISGIQKFIYNIASRKAAVSLKGRSFYLQLLIDSVIQRIITHKDIQCNIGQVVYSSGGKFYMLLPNTAKVINAITDLRAEFEKELWNEHHGQLILNLDYVPFAFNTNIRTISFRGCSPDAKIGDLWKALADKLISCKNHKFRSLVIDDYDELFSPITVSVNDKVCAVTGIEGKCKRIDPNEEEPTYVLESVGKQVELGKALKGMDYLLTYRERNESIYLSNRSKCNIGIAQIYNYLFNKEELVDDEADFRSITSADVSRVKMINHLNFLDAQIKGQRVSYGFQFYGGNRQARIATGEDKTFEDLASGTYLGILRMDIDSLGSIFIKGLPNEAKSFAAYSTLSFLLDYFFSGFLNTIRERPIFKDDVNILYSGGDDVFAVGRWDKLILFAESIRNDFAKFVGRKDISISGGLSILLSSKYPIAKAAEMAGKAEEKAKKYDRCGMVKNAFNMFGENVSWDEEFGFVKQYKDKFVSLIRDKQISMPRSILHRLMILCSKMRKGDITYIWHTAYFLKRFYDGKDEKITQLCHQLQVILCDNRNYELIAIAARWAELELREVENG